MNPSYDLDYTLADEVAEDIANAFYATERLPAHLRHWLYVPLLRLDGFEPLGHNLRLISAQLKSLLGAESYEKLSAAGQDLRAFLKNCCNPTYVVANYWSPIDARRRAIVQASRRDGAELRETLAYAYGFYALTYSGAEHGEKLWSVVHYAGIHAPRTRGFAISYKYPPDTGTPKNELYIPADPERGEHPLPEGGRGLLEELGIEESFRTILLQKREIDTEQMANALSKVLNNIPGDPWPDLDHFASQTIELFTENVSKLPTTLKNHIEKARAFLSNLFHDNTITFNQACFMVATHLIWRKACGGDFMYAFPIVIGNTRCVLTMGTNARIPLHYQVAIRDLAHSLFGHPMFLDYAYRQFRPMHHEGRRAVSAISELSELGLQELRGVTHIENLRRDLARRFQAISDQSLVLRWLFNRSTRFTIREEGPPKTAPVEEFVRGSYLPFERRAKRLKAVVELPETKTNITASLADMQCVFGNLFENSLYWLEQASEQDRRIVIAVKATNGGVEVLFGDNGPGVPEKMRELLFQPYFSTKPDGGGVGLARVKEIVNEYGGTIDLAVPGLLRGATFRIVLPCQSPQQEVSHVA